MEVSAPAVLLYHRIGIPRPASLVAGQYVAPFLFRSEMEYLLNRGGKGVSLAEAVARRGLNQGANDKFCVTFDDAFLSVYEKACPILAARDIPATVYVVAGGMGGSNEWDKRAGDVGEPTMSESQVRELSDAGLEIGSHTMTHPHLSHLSDDEIRTEIRDSKHRLEDLIGREVASLAYPYGDYDARAVAAAIEAGYSNAVATTLGVLVQGTSLFEVPRVNVRWNAIGPHLMNKIKRARRASGVTA